MTLQSHWVAISWPSKRTEEEKLQEMSLCGHHTAGKRWGGDLTLLPCHQGLPLCAPHLPVSPGLPSCWRTCSRTATELNSRAPDPSIVSWTPITLPLVILPNDLSMQDMTEPSPRNTPDLPDLCMKAPRAGSYPLSEIPAAEGKRLPQEISCPCAPLTLTYAEASYVSPCLALARWDEEQKKRWPKRVRTAPALHRSPTRPTCLSYTAKPPNRVGWDPTELDWVGFAGGFGKLFQQIPREPMGSCGHRNHACFVS